MKQSRCIARDTLLEAGVGHDNNIARDYIIVLYDDSFSSFDTNLRKWLV